MSVFSADELTALQGCQEAFMDDVCQLGTVTITSSETGDESEDVAWGPDIPCGLRMRAGQGSEWRNGALTMTDWDADLRLPHDVDVSLVSKVRITRRHGDEVSIVYDVHGEPAVGPSGIVCYLRRVTT